MSGTFRRLDGKPGSFERFWPPDFCLHDHRLPSLPNGPGVLG